MPIQQRHRDTTAPTHHHAYLYHHRHCHQHNSMPKLSHQSTPPPANYLDQHHALSTSSSTSPSLTYIHCSQPSSIRARFDPTSQCCCIASTLTPHCLVAGWFVACGAWFDARCSVPTTATDWWLDINHHHHNTSSNVRLAVVVYWQVHHGCGCMLPQITGWCCRHMSCT
jgi:hypothetical protein